MFCNSQSMLMGSCLHRSWTVGDSCAFIPALDTEVTIKTRKLRGMMSELPGGAQLLPWALQECRVSFLPNTPHPTSPPPPHASHRACLFVFFPWSQKNLPKLTLVCVSSFHICCYPWILTSLMRENKGSPNSLKCQSPGCIRGNHSRICLSSNT